MNQKLRKFFGTHGEIHPEPFPQPVFITGLMRSGTTYLSDILSCHPQILKVGFELRQAWSQIGGADCIESGNYLDADNSDHIFSNNMTYYYSRFIAESKTVKRHLMRAKIKFTKGHGRLFYDWDNIIPLNKFPHFTNRIKFINALYPNSKIILIVRSIEGHCSSMKSHFDNEYLKHGTVNSITEDVKNAWITNVESANPITDSTYPKNFSVIPKMWIRLNELALKEISDLPESQKTIITYEDLFNHQNTIIPKIFEFVGTDTRHNKKIRKISDKRFTKRNTSTIGNPLDKWKKYLSKEEVEQLYQIIKENQEQYDYIRSVLDTGRMKP